MRRLAFLGFLLAADPLTAQTSSPVARAAASITPADVAHRIGIIADDSMMGRDTPSRGLELTASTSADSSGVSGCSRAGDSGTWFQRYPITRRRLDLAARRWSSGGRRRRLASLHLRGPSGLGPGTGAAHRRGRRSWWPVHTHPTMPAARASRTRWCSIPRDF